MFLLLVSLISLSAVYSRTEETQESNQVRDLIGIVLDIDAVPITGVNVMVSGTTIGTITDSDGRFSLRVPAIDSPTLTFSFLGYIPQEIKFKGQKSLNIILREASVQIEDIVVVGYGTQKKQSVTGALSSLNPKELERISTPMLSNTLGGSMPGIISRQSSGEPGYDNASIYIRGIATMGTASQAPLVLVDGVERDINVINSAEIENFTILKDASATAVYGVRGANGVILIETRKGKKGKAQVSYRSEFANLHGLRFPSYINGYEFASLMNEACLNSGLTEAQLPWKEEELQQFKDGSDPYLHPSVNWTDEVLKKDAFQTINNLSASGGNETVRYFVNVGYSSQTGLFKEDPKYKYSTNSKSDRYNFRSNVDINISRNFVVDLGLGGIIQDRTYPGSNAQWIFDSMKRISPISYSVRNPDGTPGGGVSYLMDNPWARSTQSGYAKQFRNTLQGTFGGKWDLSTLVTKGLSFSGKFAYDNYLINEVTRRKDYEVKQYLGKDPVTGEDLYNVVRKEGAMGYGLFQSSNRSYYYETTLNYERAFGKNRTTAMFLFNRNDYKDLTAGSSIFNLPYRRQGIAGRLTYDRDSRYLAEFNFGYNGSENFPKGQRYGFFPSGSLGWVLSNESFWSLDFVNHLKFRGSYGVVGNDQVGGGRFLYLSTVNKLANGYHFGNSMAWLMGYAEDKMGVSDITWEKSHKLDVGIDLEMLYGFITIQADYFKEKRRDILLQRGIVPNITGVTAGSIPWANVGSADNEGFDFNLNIKKTTGYGLFYTIRANATYAHNKIIDDDTAIQKWDNMNTRGFPIGQPFGLVAQGLFSDQVDIDNSIPQNLGTSVQPGDIKYKDVNGDGVVDTDDISPIGYTRIPEIMFGLGGTVAYKGIELSLQFSGASHTSTFFDADGMWPYQLEYPNYNVLREYYDHRWIPGAADNSQAKYPAVIKGNNTNNYRTSTLYQRNAEYIKLKNAEVAYNFNKSFTKSLNIESLRVFLNGINLLCFDHLKVIDPESNYGTGGYPQQRTMNIGAQVTF